MFSYLPPEQAHPGVRAVAGTTEVLLAVDLIVAAEDDVSLPADARW
ncbi:MAG: hypothetical protein M3P40_02840 [Actinomycetota bacterium]|nr:hypothetical protein [Actinomycetota bacterium]